jgi:hypothetical protein
MSFKNWGHMNASSSEIAALNQSVAKLAAAVTALQSAVSSLQKQGSLVPPDHGGPEHDHGISIDARKQKLEEIRRRNEHIERTREAVAALTAELDRTGRHGEKDTVQAAFPNDGDIGRAADAALDWLKDHFDRDGFTFFERTTSDHTGRTEHFKCDVKPSLSDGHFAVSVECSGSF